MSDDLLDDLSLAHSLVTQASEIALGHYRAGLEAHTKPDGSPVTKADLEVERSIVLGLRRERPDDGVLGEELGAAGSSRRRWIIDPIDGTFNFVAGNPKWGTHLALEEDGEIRFGVIGRPAQSRRFWAARGHGAFRADEAALDEATRISVSDRALLSECRATFWAEEPHACIDRLRAHTRFVTPDFDAILDLAEGRIEAVVVPTGGPWDHAPAAVLVEEAGGRFSDAEGGRRIDRGECRFSNGHVHDALVALLASD